MRILLHFFTLFRTLNTVDGKMYGTVEHYFQAEKFQDLNYAEKIRTVKSPKEAKKLGQSRDYQIKNDWNRIRNDVMFKGCLTKFEQHEDIRKMLLDTGNATLIENARYDSYWGNGLQGNGKNMLGKTLMEIRDYLRNAYKVSIAK
ncbi:uncharacterized protein LOC116342985 [Contarinia nasturtii]|uniref:uncharacterized protein LOC116342985 n=1 Tax=Contarinia nasturtii TaxID=265458 RepID=UPI0012D4015C|nr:uncharacterized protein LOC116342985 [Contarinia nasturtii]